jgi:hypothetical protein
MNPILRTVLLLTCSNVFMTFAWYAHLKNLSQKPWIVAALISWGIALFEYLLQVPANRIGYTVLTLPQLKIIQEVITLTVFVPFVWIYMRQPLKLDYLWAAFCMMGAVYFVFRKRGNGGRESGAETGNRELGTVKEILNYPPSSIRHPLSLCPPLFTSSSMPVALAIRASLHV